jgi:hypothetical protein
LATEAPCFLFAAGCAVLRDLGWEAMTVAAVIKFALGVAGVVLALMIAWGKGYRRAEYAIIKTIQDKGSWQEQSSNGLNLRIVGRVEIVGVERREAPKVPT